MSEDTSGTSDADAAGPTAEADADADVDSGADADGHAGESTARSQSESASGSGTDDADEAAPAGADAAAEVVEGVDPALAERVGEYDEGLAAEVERLQERIVELDRRLADRDERVEQVESQLARTRADFQNYKKRSKRKQEEIRERATEAFVERVVGVRDNLVRALDQEEGADIRGGVQATLEEFDRVLREENVEPIEPDPGSETDPLRHQVMTTVDSDLPEGTIVDVYRPGYEMAGSVIREAQVTVSTGAFAADQEGDPANGETDGAATASEEDTESVDGEASGDE
jgi:molecular chaperone GrpE